MRTQTPYGDVHLVFEFQRQAPRLDTSGWQEVVEGSMRFAAEILLTNPADQYVGDGTPQIIATGEMLELSPDRRGARITTCGWGDKNLYGAVIAFTRALPSEARKWEIEAEFTLTGPGGQMWIVPNEDEEYADFLPLPDPGPENRWHIIVYVRGRDSRREDGEYYVTVWPEA
ncbi:hypothetical protein [Micromonospora sp. CPCC 206061]|uniref:hypothetical protein n=1 Tax=Micromonospora sp. CPCC 206061 TaxID=3122410 RepID=UPI002FEF6274